MRSTSRWIRRFAGFAGLSVLAGIGTLLHADFANPTTAFDPADLIDAGQDPVAVAAADFDGDGIADLAFADADGSVVRIERNDGSGGAFDEDAIVVGGPAFVDMAVGFLDAGTTPDFAVTNGSAVSIGRNDGVVGPDVTFLLAGPFTLDASATVRKVAIADYNHDGFGDVVVAGRWVDMDHADGGFVAVFFGDGTTLTLAPSGLEILNDPVTALAAGDLDGDGFAEILTGDDATQSVVVFGNPATGSVDLGFGVRSYATAALFPRSIALGDVTEDGHVDAVVAGSGDYQFGQNRTAFTVLRNNGTVPMFLAYETQIIHSFPSGADQGRLPAGVAIGDVDGEAGPEIVASQPLEARVAVFHLDNVVDGPTSTFVPGAIRTFDCGGLPHGVALAQLNPATDAKLDVVTVNGAVNQSAVLLNATGGGGGGEEAEGDPLPPATNLSLKVSNKAPKADTFLELGKITFTCTQTAATRGLQVRLQSTETPADEPTWTDIPGGTMARGKGKKTTTFTAKLIHVPAGRRYFRTVTWAHGYPDGIGDTLSGTAFPPSPADGYIGPYTVKPVGSVITMETTIGSIGLNGLTRTYPGDILFATIRVTNDGNLPTGVATISTSTPNNTQFRGAAPDTGTPNPDAANDDEYFVHEPRSINEKLTWVVPNIAPGESKEFYYSVDVTNDGNPNGVDMTASTDCTIKGIKVKQVTIPATGTKIFIPFVSPLTLEVKEVTKAPAVGGIMTYELIAKNAGAATIDKCVAWDRLPDGTAYEVAYFADGRGDPVTTTDTWGDGRQNPTYDRASRKVFWLVGSLAGGAEKRMRLDVRLQNDLVPGSALVNGAYLLQGCRLGDTRCSVLDLGTLQAQSGEPVDVTTRTSTTPPAGMPDLRFSQFAVVPGDSGTDGKRQIGGFGFVAVAERGGDVLHELVVENFGTDAARAVRVTGNLPADAEFVPGSVTVTPTRPAGATFAPVSTISTGGTLHVVVGNMGPNTAVRVEYRFTVKPTAPLFKYITATDWAVFTDSVSRIGFASPSYLPVYISGDFLGQCTVRSDLIGSLALRDRVTVEVDLKNAGNAAGVGCTCTITPPRGVILVDRATLFDAQGAVVENRTIDPDPKKAPASLTFQVGPRGPLPAALVGPVLPGPAGKVRFTIEYNAFQKGASSLDTIVTFKSSRAAKKEGTPGAVTKRVSFPTEAPGQTEIVIWEIGNITAVTGEYYDYTVVIGNVRDEDAKNVVVKMGIPKGAGYSEVQFTTPGPGTKYVGRDRVIWNVGTLPAHSAVIRQFSVIVDAKNPVGELHQDTLTATAKNAIFHIPDPLRTFVLVKGRKFDGYKWAATESVLRGLGLHLEGEGGGALAPAVTLSTIESLVTVSRAEAVDICNGGPYVATLGGGNVVATGAYFRVDPSATKPYSAISFPNGTGGVYVGPGDIVTATNLPGTPTLNQVLDRAQEFAALRCVNVFTGTTATLVSKRGDRQILTNPALPTIPIAPSSVDPATLVRAPSGGIVAAGGGNIVAAGGGNIVGAGGGNLSTAGGGKVLSHNGNAVLSNDGAGVVSNDGAGLVGQDGAALIGNDGAGLVGQDGAGKK